MPSTNNTFSTNASTRARTSTFWGESSWPMNSAESVALVGTISSTSTRGGGTAGGAAGLHPPTIHSAAAAANTAATRAGDGTARGGGRSPQVSRRP
ncbi:MAG: hypothetical protein M5U12_35025 [Verrucomicrobia bacterium]|nr:hypothetical protein [Verrucomicrobiota bacterium]